MRSLEWEDYWLCESFDSLFNLDLEQVMYLRIYCLLILVFNCKKLVALISVKYFIMDLNSSLLNFFFSAALSKCYVLFHRMLMASCQWRNSVRAPSLIHQLYRHCHCMMDWCKEFLPEPYPLVVSHIKCVVLAHLDNKHNDSVMLLSTLSALSFGVLRALHMSISTAYTD